MQWLKLIPVNAYLCEYAPAAALYGNGAYTFSVYDAEAHKVVEVLAAVSAVGAEYPLPAAEIVLIPVEKS